MKKEPKTRQRLTVTAMHEAMCDLYFATIDPSERHKQDTPMLSATKKKNGVFIAGLLVRNEEEPYDGKTLIAEAEHSDGIEEAVAALLTKIQERFDAKRRELLAGLDAVSDRHHGALKGARSKIREKKT